MTSSSFFSPSPPLKSPSFIKKEKSPKLEMAQAGGYIGELESENQKLDPNSHASRLIKQEIARLNKGEDEFETKKAPPSFPFVEIHNDRPQRVVVRVKLPVKEFPKYNFVGKLLGPKGSTLKAMQEQTGCKMAIMGRGSMRDKDKEEELRKEGGKYAHLDEDLHVNVECYAEPSDAYNRFMGAFEELKKFIIPQMQEFEDNGMMNGAGRGGRGGFRGGPPNERGGFRGGRGAGPPPSAARGGRGGGPGGPPPPHRGAPRGGARGGAGPVRGGGRGAAPPPPSDSYGSQGNYGSGGYESGYDGYGGQNYGSGDSQYYDYGPSGGQGGGYDSYGGGYDYGESWNSGGGKTAAPSGRGAPRGARSHPYQR